MSDADSRGMLCKSYADLYDALTLCLADFVDSSEAGVVIFEGRSSAFLHVLTQMFARGPY